MCRLSIQGVKRSSCLCIICSDLETQESDDGQRARQKQQRRETISLCCPSDGLPWRLDVSPVLERTRSGYEFSPARLNHKNAGKTCKTRKTPCGAKAKLRLDQLHSSRLFHLLPFLFFGTGHKPSSAVQKKGLHVHLDLPETCDPPSASWTLPTHTRAACGTQLI